MLEAFKIKPFDLEPVYAAWTGPRFLGDPKKDPPVDDWLEEIKNGCSQHNVPKEYWHTCAQHFMGDKAKARLTELKKVMQQVHGGQYRWNWKKFKVAMRNMSCHLGRSNTITRFLSKDPVSLSKEPASNAERPVVGRAATLSFWPVRKNSKEIAVLDDTAQRPAPRKAKSEGSVLLNSEVSKALPPLPKSGDGVSTVHAPAWLLNAATALDFLQSEHPRVMSTLSAVLIVAGTIPTLPFVTAGAGGALLASSTAHAVGAIAVGIGSWIKTQQEIKDKQETHGAK
ncbi:hypothetical protein B0H19DRAFT_938015 [Mycena capillaripes]|nr:hypothetical protein B0H19DRAFT_938015 [Mycena capillaripes]